MHDSIFRLNVKFSWPSACHLSALSYYRNSKRNARRFFSVLLYSNKMAHLYGKGSRVLDINCLNIWTHVSTWKLAGKGTKLHRTMKCHQVWHFEGVVCFLHPFQYLHLSQKCYDWHGCRFPLCSGSEIRQDFWPALCPVLWQINNFAVISYARPIERRVSSGEELLHDCIIHNSRQAPFRLSTYTQHMAIINKTQPHRNNSHYN